MSIKNDRWSALSLKDRADLMNMYIANGISDIKEMKRHYNSFEDGGNKRTKIENNPSVENFIKDWYFNPTTLQIMTSIENDIYNQGIDIKSSDIEKKLNVRKALNTPEYITSLEDDKLGHHVYNSDGTSYIEYNDAYLWGSDNPSPFVRIHEIDHDIQKRMPAQTLLTTQPVEYKLNEGFKEDSYLDRPDEIRSRIMELRKFFKLNPSKRDYTPKEAAKFQEILQENELNVASGIERLSPETLAGFLNYLAYNDSNKNQEVKVAKYGGRILDGTETEQTLSGKKPTLEEFIQSKVDSTRNAAHELSLSRNKGIEIKYPLTEERRLYNEHIIDEYLYDVNRSYSPPRSDEQAEIHTLNVEDKRRVANYQQAIKELENNCEYGLNCIGSALDNYPEDSRENVNSTFAKNFEQLGFKEIDLSEARPGDIVQTVNEEGPFHGMVFSRFDEKGRPLYNYSSGGIEEGHYVKEGNFYMPINYAYTYVGTPKLIQKWTDEYNNKKAFGGRVLDGNEKEQTLSGKPIIRRRLKRGVFDYFAPTPVFELYTENNMPDITEWYDKAKATSNNFSPYPETETIQEVPEIVINPMNTVTNFNLREPLPFVNTPVDNKAFLKTITSFTPKEREIISAGYPSLSRDYFTSYVRTPVRNLRWKAQKFNGWSDEDLNYLYDKLGEAGWDPKAVMYGIDKETNFRTHVKNKNTSAIGLAQLTKEQMQTLFGENADKVYEEYANGTRSVKDVVDDTIKQYRWMYDRIKTERDNMGYGRLKINLLAPNANLDSIVSDVIYKHSLTDEQKRHLKKGKSTYRDLMKVYDKEFAKRFTKK